MDSAALCKTIQHLRTVVADGGNSEAKLLEFILVLFQLHELGFAERSPVGGAEEQDYGALRPEQAVEAAKLAILVRQFKSGHAGAGGRTVFART